MDDSSNFRGAGLGVVLKSPQGDKIVQSITCNFKATNNNEAKYEALLAGMTLAKDLSATGLDVYSDSLLVVSQITGDFTTKDSKMTSYLELAKTRLAYFNPFTITQIPRDQNTQADALANLLGSALQKSNLTSIPLAHLMTPAISKPDIVAISNNLNTNSWTKPYYTYLQHGVLPTDKQKARRLRFKASRYRIIQNTLFKISSTGLLQRCLEEAEWSNTL